MFLKLSRNKGIKFVRQKYVSALDPICINLGSSGVVNILLSRTKFSTI